MSTNQTTAATATLFAPFQLGPLALPNRIVMAPMTRNRATPDGVPTPLMALYYAQRATAGLIISESIPISPQAVGYPNTPGIYTDNHIAGWTRVLDAVHAAGGRMFAQLQHCGRISHPTMQPANAAPVAPSPIRPDGQAMTPEGPRDHTTPRALETREIPAITAQFRRAAQHALQAGFDGIEIHAANGYLIDQFLRTASNHRADAYGGTPENRMRLLNEILDAVAEVCPPGRTGVRLSPENRFNTMHDDDPRKHFTHFIERLNTRPLAYLHILEGDMMTGARTLDYPALRAKSTAPHIANNGYTPATAQTALRARAADLIALGAPFIANPDLPRRLRENLPLATPDHATYYTGGPAGYTDYPPAP